MYGNPQRRANSDVQELRREGGKWLKEQRERMTAMGSMRTGVGVSSTTPADTTAADATTKLDESSDAGLDALGGHGTGAGPNGTGASTTRLDDQP